MKNASNIKLKPENNKLLPFNQAVEWANQAVREKKWLIAAQRWAVLRKAYPDKSVVWLQAAKAHIEANQLEQAESLLDYARQHFPDNPNTFLVSAELAIKLEHWELAEKLLQQSRENFSDVLQTWLLSASYCANRGNQKLATEYNQQARERAPDQIYPYIQFAEFAMRSQQWQEALERWALLRRHFPAFPQGYRRAAEAARKLGNNRLARQLMLELEYGESIAEHDSSVITPAVEKTNRHVIKHLSELVWTKAVFNLRSEAYRNYLSYVWLVLEPILHILVFYIIFSLLLHRGGENFLVFLFAGQIPWMWFSKAVSGSSGSILAGKNLMLQVGLPPIVFPLIDLLKISLQHIPVFFMLFAFICLQGFPPNVFWWYLIPVIFVQLMLIMACTCTVAAIIPFARDLNYLVHTGLMFLMFGSGIFYDYKTLSTEWQELFLLNPIAFLLNSYRDILIYNSAPDLIALAGWGGISFFACLLIALVYARLRYIYPKVVME